MQEWLCWYDVFLFFLCLLFCSSHFSFLVFGHFWGQSYENTKILYNHCLHFTRQDWQDGKKQKENLATKVNLGVNQSTKVLRKL